MAASALLIASWEFYIPSRTRTGTATAADEKKADRKSGIKRAYKKNGDEIPPEQWAIGDLENMENFMGRKRIHVFRTYNYLNQEEDGTFALGTKDIKEEIDAFFKQDEKSHFILYFTGHGARDDGSWCFTTTKVVDEGAAETQHQARKTGAEPAPQPSQNQRRMAGNDKRPDPNKKSNQFLLFEDVIQKWDENKRGRQRYLMLILDCCHSGKWVDKVNAMTIQIPNGDHVKRRDICIQASCRPVELSRVAGNQLCSVFTRAFVAAQNKSSLEKYFLSALDHAFVLNFVSLAYAPIQHPFTPISSDLAPFGDIKFFDSFDDMFLKT